MPSQANPTKRDVSPKADREGPERCGVVAVPVSVFYDDPEDGRSQVRFAFCKRDDVLHEAAGRLRRLAP
ncbi:putative N-succinyldiaminopimelate aminotransferase DapC [Streptomyces sp. AVP053U2]|nr:putative N-succinyldiaminopimelate aminotransferase DapC [Streptomyces sp. AVP053U2]